MHLRFILQLSGRESKTFASPAYFVGSNYCFFCKFLQVIKRVKVQTESAEDVWALKFMNFIFGANQLLFDGLTRELPL